MASVDKFTHENMLEMVRHNNRESVEYRNVDIDPERTHLNYSFEMNHGELSDYEYYQKLVDSMYLYGRGTKREDTAITGCGWVVTAPIEIVGNKDKEDAFFEGVFDFISNRYGPENIINNSVHYDEGGAPHIHVIITPVTELDHDRVHYKTSKTKNAVRLDSGRYEYEHVFKLDDDGNKIPLKNYAKMSDYYSQKISANDVINKVELKNFHTDLQQYLKDNDIEGRVKTGRTSGINYSVDALKEFTEKTGFTLKDIEALKGDKTILASFVEQLDRINELEIENGQLRQELKEVKLELEQVRNNDLEEKRTSSWDRSSGWGSDSHDRWGRSATNDYEETRDL